MIFSHFVHTKVTFVFSVSAKNQNFRPAAERG